MSWENVVLGDICLIRPPKSELKKSHSMNQMVSFLGMEHLGINQKNVEALNSNLLSEVYSGYTYFANDDVLLAKITPCFENGKLGIARNLINGIGFGSSEFFVFRPNNKILSEYLYYFLSQKIFINEGKQHMTGAVGHKRVSKEFIENYKIPLPPIVIQQKIVTKLDAIFTEIDKATAAAEANIKNAEALFQCYLTEVFERGGAEWELKKLSEISFEMGRGKSKHRPRNDERLFGGSYPFIQTGDVRNSNMYINSYHQTYNEVGLSQSKLWPAKTVCITIAANIAEIGVLNFDACFPDSLIGIIPDTKKISTEFLFYMLNFAKKIIKSYSKGSAQENINLGTFENMFFKVPTLETQNTVVEQMNDMKLLTSNILNSQQLKINNLTALKQSILQQAFNGELVKE